MDFKIKNFKPTWHYLLRYSQFDDILTLQNMIEDDSIKSITFGYDPYGYGHIIYDASKRYDDKYGPVEMEEMEDFRLHVSENKNLNWKYVEQYYEPMMYIHDIYKYDNKKGSKKSILY